MKKVILYSSVVFIMLACNKKEEKNEKHYNPYFASATLNGDTNWVSKGAYKYNGYLDSTINLSFSSISEDLFYQEYLRINNIPTIVGIKQSLSIRISGVDKKNTTYFSTSEYDSSTEWFDLYEGEEVDNFVIIDSIHANGNISGRFELTFIISPESTARVWEHLPDTLVYENGTFLANYIPPTVR